MRISDWSSDVCSSDLLARRNLQEVGDRLVDHGRLLHHLSLGRVVLDVERFVQRSVVGIPPWEKPGQEKQEDDPRRGQSQELGRASCRESVCRYVEISVFAIYF